jgi:hypothetical protein
MEYALGEFNRSEYRGNDILSVYFSQDQFDQNDDKNDKNDKKNEKKSFFSQISTFEQNNLTQKNDDKNITPYISNKIKSILCGDLVVSPVRSLSTQISISPYLSPSTKVVVLYHNEIKPDQTTSQNSSLQHGAVGVQQQQQQQQQQNLQDKNVQKNSEQKNAQQNAQNLEQKKDLIIVEQTYPLDTPDVLLFGSTQYAVMTSLVGNGNNIDGYNNQNNNLNNSQNNNFFDHNLSQNYNNYYYQNHYQNYIKNKKLSSLPPQNFSENNKEISIIFDIGFKIQPKSYTLSHSNLTTTYLKSTMVSMQQSGQINQNSQNSQNSTQNPTQKTPPSTLLSNYQHLSFSPDTNTGYLRSWQLLASDDGIVWYIIANHVNDMSISSPGIKYKFDVSPQGKSMWCRYFKVLLTGPNNNQQWNICLSSFDIDGFVLLK